MNKNIESVSEGIGESGKGDLKTTFILKENFESVKGRIGETE